MSGDELERALHAFVSPQPFRPFLQEFTSGHRLVITHPEAMDRVGEVFLFRGPDRGHRIFAGPGVCQVMDLPSAQRQSTETQE